MNIQPRISIVNKEINCLGLMIHTNIKTVYKDLPKVYDRYMNLFNKNLISNIKRPWEYISLIQNYDTNMTWDYYTGHVITKYEDIYEDIVKFKVPEGEYAVFEVRCKKQIFFGIKIAKIKKYIYTNWLPKSEYEFSGYEFEYNNEEMKKKSPYDVDMYIGIKKK